MMIEGSGNLIGSANSCSTPKQMSATEQAFDLVRQNKLQMFDTLGFLEKRLGPIIRPDEPSEESYETAKDEIEPVMLVASIKEMANDFAYANKRIKSLIERLEI